MDLVSHPTFLQGVWISCMFPLNLSKHSISSIPAISVYSSDSLPRGEGFITNEKLKKKQHRFSTDNIDFPVFLLIFTALLGAKLPFEVLTYDLDTSALVNILAELAQF